MNELVQMVQQKTGLSQDMAQKVVDTVVRKQSCRRRYARVSTNSWAPAQAVMQAATQPLLPTMRADSWERRSPWSPTSLRSRVHRIANRDRQSQDGETTT